MDMDFNQTKKRRQRKVKEMEEYVQNMIELINNFISCTKKKLQEKGNIEKESSLLDNS